MKTKNNIRHGDIALLEIDSLPKGLEQANTKTLLSGDSGGNPHTFTSGKFYQNMQGNQIGFLVANKTTRLGHKEHGSPKLKAGIYKVIRQIEFREDGEMFVED